ATPASDGSISVIMTGPELRTGTIRLAVPVSSNLVPINGGTALAFTDLTGTLQAIQITGPSSYITLWSGYAAVGTQPTSCLQAIDANTFAILDSNGRVVFVKTQGRVESLGYAVPAPNPDGTFCVLGQAVFVPVGGASSSPEIIAGNLSGTPPLSFKLTAQP